MPRWEAGAEQRLVRAAYELYLEYGFEDVTVAQIAERAGLTKRTFFRYFADKREVLFSGSGSFLASVVAGVADAPAGTSPIDAVIASLATAGSSLTELGEGARQRQRLIEASPDLREREMIKMASLTAGIADALRQRGVGEPAASIAARAGVGVFTTAFERWAAAEGTVAFPPLMDRALGELRSAIGAGPSTTPADPPAPGRPRVS